MAISLGILTQHFQTNPYGDKIEKMDWDSWGDTILRGWGGWKDWAGGKLGSDGMLKTINI